MRHWKLVLGNEIRSSVRAVCALVTGLQGLTSKPTLSSFPLALYLENHHPYPGQVLNALRPHCASKEQMVAREEERWWRSKITSYPQNFLGYPRVSTSSNMTLKI